MTTQRKRNIAVSAAIERFKARWPRISMRYAVRCAAFACMVLAPSPQAADVPAARGPISGLGYHRQLAVFIGVNGYLHAPNLAYAVNDARDLRGALISEFGYKTEDQVFLNSDVPKAESVERDKTPTATTPFAVAPGMLATKIAIEQVFAKGGWIDLRNTQEDDLLLVFFSGHGAVDANGDSFILGVDSDPNNLAATAVKVEWLRDRIAKLRCRHKVLILDSCFSGLLFRATTLDEQHAQARAVALPGLKMASNSPQSPIEPYSAPSVSSDATLKLYLKRNAFFGFSAGRDTVVTEGLGDGLHSIFTSAMLEVLNDRADSRRADHTFTFREMAPLVESKVRDAKVSVNQLPLWGILGEGSDGDVIFRETRSRLTSRQKVTRLAEDRLYYAQLQNASDHIRANDMTPARFSLMSTDSTHRSWEFQYLADLCGPAPQALDNDNVARRLLAEQPAIRDAAFLTIMTDGTLSPLTEPAKSAYFIDIQPGGLRPGFSVLTQDTFQSVLSLVTGKHGEMGGGILLAGGGAAEENQFAVIKLNPGFLPETVTTSLGDPISDDSLLLLAIPHSFNPFANDAYSLVLGTYLEPGSGDDNGQQLEQRCSLSLLGDSLTLTEWWRGDVSMSVVRTPNLRLALPSPNPTIESLTDKLRDRLLLTRTHYFEAGTTRNSVVQISKGRALVFTNHRGLQVFDLTTQRLTKLLQIDIPDEPDGSPDNPSYVIPTVSVSTDGRFFAAYPVGDGKCTVYTTASLVAIASFDAGGTEDLARSFTLSPRGTYLKIAAKDHLSGECTVWEVASQNKLVEINESGVSHRITGITWPADEAVTLLLGDGITILDRPGGKTLHRFPALTTDSSLKHSPQVFSLKGQPRVLVDRHLFDTSNWTYLLSFPFAIVPVDTEWSRFITAVKRDDLRVSADLRSSLSRGDTLRQRVFALQDEEYNRDLAVSEARETQKGTLIDYTLGVGAADKASMSHAVTAYEAAKQKNPSEFESRMTLLKTAHAASVGEDLFEAWGWLRLNKPDRARRSLEAAKASFRDSHPLAPTIRDFLSLGTQYANYLTEQSEAASTNLEEIVKQSPYLAIHLQSLTGDDGGESSESSSDLAEALSLAAANDIAGLSKELRKEMRVAIANSRWKTWLDSNLGVLLTYKARAFAYASAIKPGDNAKIGKMLVVAQTPDFGSSIRHSDNPEFAECQLIALLLELRGFGDVRAFCSNPVSTVTPSLRYSAKEAIAAVETMEEVLLLAKQDHAPLLVDYFNALHPEEKVTKSGQLAESTEPLLEAMVNTLFTENISSAYQRLKYLRSNKTVLLTIAEK